MGAIIMGMGVDDEEGDAMKVYFETEDGSEVVK